MGVDADGAAQVQTPLDDPAAQSGQFAVGGDAVDGAVRGLIGNPRPLDLGIGGIFTPDEGQRGVDHAILFIQVAAAQPHVLFDHVAVGIAVCPLLGVAGGTHPGPAHVVQGHDGVDILRSGLAHFTPGDEGRLAAHELQQGVAAAHLAQKGAGVFQGRFPLFLADIGLFGPDQQVFGGVAQVDELQHLHLIAPAFQQLGPHRVGGQGAEPLLEDAVRGHGRQGVGFDSEVQLMLAAGHRQNVPCAPLHGVPQGVIGGGVAGVEGDDHVGGLLCHIILDVAAVELQTVVAVFYRYFIAVVDDILFQVQPCNIGLFVENFGDVIIDHKGQIGLSAAEVDDAHRVTAVLCQKVVQKLQKPVDLLELVVFCLDDATIGGQDSQIHQRRHDHALGD